MMLNKMRTANVKLKFWRVFQFLDGLMDPILIVDISLYLNHIVHRNTTLIMLFNLLSKSKGFH
jgi:hypothetical protein